jgi:hypothetical protein
MVLRIRATTASWKDEKSTGQASPMIITLMSIKASGYFGGVFNCTFGKESAGPHFGL